MKRVAFLVEPNFKNLHYGVRNYFSTIKDILSDDFETEYITYMIFEGEILWYRLVFEDIEDVEKIELDQCISVKKGFNYLK